MESFNNYTSPRKNDEYKEVESKLEEIIKEKN